MLDNYDFAEDKNGKVIMKPTGYDHEESYLSQFSDYELRLFRLHLQSSIHFNKLRSRVFFEFNDYDVEELINLVDYMLATRKNKNFANAKEDSNED